MAATQSLLLLRYPLTTLRTPLATTILRLGPFSYTPCRCVIRHFVLCTVAPLDPVVPVVLTLTLTLILIVLLSCPTALPYYPGIPLCPV